MSEDSTPLTPYGEAMLGLPPVPTSESASIDQLAAALAKAQGTISAALATTPNEFFGSQYADLADVWEACRAPLSENDLSVVQRCRQTDSGPILLTRLLHASGQWIEGEIPLIVDAKGRQNPMQQLGSALTYARRYGLSSIVGVAPEQDDDAESVERRQSQRKPKGEEPILGKYKKTELKEQLRAFNADLDAADDTATLAGVLQGYGEALKQCREELPSWWYGAEGSDALGLADRITRKQQQLQAAEASGEQTPLDAG